MFNFGEQKLLALRFSENLHVTMLLGFHVGWLIINGLLDSFLQRLFREKVLSATYRDILIKAVGLLLLFLLLCNIPPCVAIELTGNRKLTNDG